MNEPTAPPVLDPPALAAPPPVRWGDAREPRVWPSLLAPFAAFVASALASGTVIVVVALLADPALTRGEFAGNLERWTDDHMADAVTVIPLLAASQVAILATALLFALTSRESVPRRLGFTRWKVANSTVALAVVGTLGVQFLLDLAGTWLIDETSESLKRLARMFLEPRGLAAVGVGFAMSVLPGVCEEALFRGFTQRGLLRRWSPFAAIAVTSVLFAMMHADVQHSLFILPLGAWLGFVAWKTGSVWPAVLAHFANNLGAFLTMRMAGTEEILETDVPPALLVVGLVCLGAAILATLRLARVRPEAG